jgi:hypothetical protein
MTRSYTSSSAWRLHGIALLLQEVINRHFTIIILFVVLSTHLICHMRYLFHFIGKHVLTSQCHLQAKIFVKN